MGRKRKAESEKSVSFTLSIKKELLDQLKSAGSPSRIITELIKGYLQSKREIVNMEINFSPEELTFLQHYKAPNKEQTIIEITRVIPLIEEEEMKELAENVLVKLNKITEDDFKAIDFNEVIEADDVENV